MASDDARKLGELEQAYEAALASAEEHATKAKEAEAAEDDSAAAEAYQSAEKAIEDAKAKRKERDELAQAVATEKARRDAISGALDELRKEDSEKRANEQRATLDMLAGTPENAQAQRERDEQRRDEEHASHVNADYKPSRWDPSVGASAQHADVRKLMGSNLKAQESAYNSAFRALCEVQLSRKTLEYTNPDAFRTLQQAITTGITTGALVEPWIPDEFISNVIVDPGTPGAALLEACTVYPAQSKKGSAPTFAGNEFRRGTENSDLTADDPTASEIDYEVGKIYLYHELSNEAREDIGFNIEAELSANVVRARLRFISQEVVQGNGTPTTHAQFQGLRQDTVVTRVASAANTAITLDDTRNLLTQLPAQFRGQDVRFFTTSTIVEQVFDGMAAQANIDERNTDPFGMLHGRPVMLWDGTGWEAVGAASRDVAAVGSFRNYILFERAGLTVATSEDVNFKSDGYAIRTTMRMDGRIALANAFRILETP